MSSTPRWIPVGIILYLVEPKQLNQQKGICLLQPSVSAVGLGIARIRRKLLSGLVKARKRKLSRIAWYKERVAGKAGLEIGGPSQVFGPQGILPIYAVVGQLDGCNFSDETVWHGSTRDNTEYEYLSPKQPGRRFVCDAADLSQIPGNQFDFILNSHVLEHIANPLKALCEWKRVIRDDGSLIVIVPWKALTFDHLRGVTPFQHLVDDYEAKTPESDKTHVEEMLELYDPSLNPDGCDIDSFRHKAGNNTQYRVIHHHLFDPALLGKCMEFAGFGIRALELVWPGHIVGLGIPSSPMNQ